MKAPNCLVIFFLLVFPCVAGMASAQPPATGSLTIVGSDTLSLLITEWTEQFYAEHPSISVEIQAIGSAAAPPALQQGTANIGTMSRPMNRDERAAFLALRGYQPTEIALAEDAVVFIAHPSNPISAISDDMVARIFGMPGTCGTSGRILRWNQLDPKHPLGSKAIQVFGRTATSGTYQYFRRAALCDGDPGVFTNEIPGSSGVVNTIARLPSGLAYSPVTHAERGVKVLDIIMRDGRVLSPTDADYPFKRMLYMYTATALQSAKDSPECSFIKFIAAPEGLASLRAAGFRVPSTDQSLTIKGAADACL